MKRINLIYLLMLALPFTGLVNCSHKTVTSEPPAGPEYKLRAYRDVTLKNGLKVTLIEDKTLPYFSLLMRLRVGSAQDPKGKEGLSSFVAEMLDKGTQKRTANELSDEMALYAGDFEASASEDSTKVAASSLSYHQDDLLAHFAEILTQPKFSEAEVLRLRKQILAQLQQVSDNAEAVAEIAFKKYLLGEHPYAHIVAGNSRSIKSLKQKDITEHYSRYYRPSQAHLAVIGNFSKDIIEKLEIALAGWSDIEVTPETPVNFPTVHGLSILLVDRGDLKQSQILMGHQGIARNNPDFIPLRVANTILGAGGFSSRLMKEVRVKRGLTYGIDSGFTALKNQGPFSIDTYTRLDKVGEAVREAMRVYQEFVTQGVTQEELNGIKALLIGQFPRALETAEALANNLLTLRHYGVPDSYLTTYISKVQQVSLDDIKRVTATYFTPQNMKILIYAPKEVALPQLKGIAPVEVKNYKSVL